MSTLDLQSLVSAGHIIQLSSEYFLSENRLNDIAEQLKVEWPDKARFVVVWTESDYSCIWNNSSTVAYFASSDSFEAYLELLKNWKQETEGKSYALRAWEKVDLELVPITSLDYKLSKIAPALRFPEKVTQNV